MSVELLSNCLFTVEIGIAVRLGIIAVFGRKRKLPGWNCKYRVSGCLVIDQRHVLVGYNVFLHKCMRFLHAKESRR